MSEYIKSCCQHVNTICYEGVSICMQCATYLPKQVLFSHLFIYQGSPAYKERFLCRNIDLSPYQLYLNMLLEQNRSKVRNKDALYVKVYIYIYIYELQSRKPLVDWVYEIGDKLKLSNQTIHIGIFYMDYCLCMGDYSKGKYQLVALTSLIIAGIYLY